MTVRLIDGRACARELKHQVAAEAKDLREDGMRCGLATLSVGEEFSAAAYQRRLLRVSEELDIAYRHRHLPGDAGLDDVLGTIARLNADPEVSGILVLRPLPPHIDEKVVFRALDPLKDVEAVHPENAGLLALGTPRYVPSTAASVYHLLDTWLDSVGEDRADFYHRSLIVVVGRSNNVGKPAVSLGYARQAAVESIDEWASRTVGIGRHTRRADVLVVAAGRPGLIRAEHIREGAIVLDVGINPWTDPETGTVHMVGDVDFESTAPRAWGITPVPGGVGPITDVWLVRNTVTAARNLAGRPDPRRNP